LDAKTVIDRIRALAAGAVFFIGIANPAQAQNPTGFVDSSGTLRFAFPGVTPTVVCQPLFVCDIILQPDEAVQNIATGDSARWVIAAGTSGPNGTTPHVFIKPTATNLRTNLVITTTKHIYYLMLASTTATRYPRIGFYYPQEEKAAADARALAQQQEEEERRLDLPLLPPDQLDTHYRITGDRALSPSRVYNDRVHTFIEFDVLPNDLPVLYAIAADGSNEIVNYRLKDKMFIIDGVPGGIDLVLNAGTGHHGHGERRVNIRHT
jgi:type IV secretion system protein VirB9